MSSLWYTQPPDAATRLPSQGSRRGGSSQRGLTQWDEDDGGSEADSAVTATEAVYTGIHTDVYGACFVLTVRGLHDRRYGTVLMAWMWVVLVVAVKLIIIWSVHQYINRDLAEEYGTRNSVTTALIRLQGFIANNTTPNKALPGDRGIIKLCEGQPGTLFWFVVHFIWSSRMMGTLSEARTLFSSVYFCPVRESRKETIQATRDEIIVSGLMELDALVFTVLLVLPKTIGALLLWLVGSELLALTRDVGRLLLKAVVMYYIANIQNEVFSSFLSHSKKEWILQAKVVQVRPAALNLFLSWPGEAAKLLFVYLACVSSRFIWSKEHQVRELCQQCKTDCPNSCSKAFDYCLNDPDWPFNWHR